MHGDEHDEADGGCWRRPGRGPAGWQRSRLTGLDERWLPHGFDARVEALLAQGGRAAAELARAATPAPDRRLAKRLERDARAAAKERARLELAHAKAVRQRERARFRARRDLPAELLLGAGSLISIPLHHETASFAGFLAAAAAGLGIRSVAALRRPPVPQLHLPPPAEAPAPPPHRGSVAFPAVRRLEAVRAELTRLLPLVSPAGRDVAQEAWEAAGQADAALRWQAARLAAVEPHRGADPELLVPLLAGVARQEQLVVAVCDLVVASADPLAHSRIADATDAVHGLAQGLREVR